MKVKKHPEKPGAFALTRQNCCVIGYPIRHSLSPIIHNTLYDIYGIDCEYDIMEVKPGEIGRFIQDVPSKNICGFNVTMPYKKDIIPFLYNIPQSESVNTVAVRDGKLYGTSTDEAGFLKSLSEKGFGYKNQNIVFLGAGAVTGALARDAAKKGAKYITLLNRTLDKAQAIANHIGGSAELFESKKAYDCIADCGLLINTTPLGMAGCPQFESFEFLKNLNAQSLVCDLVYHPFHTDFLKQAKKQGTQTLGGVSMLIWQAFFAFEYFFGIMPNEKDKKTVLKKIEDHLKE